MSSSPISSTSSSDLYSPSENPELVPIHPGESTPLNGGDVLSSNEEHNPYSSGCPNDQLRNSLPNDGPVIVNGINRESDTANPASHARSNRQSDGIYHKRKRDEAEDPYQDFQGHPSVSKSSGDAQDTKQASSHVSGNEIGHPQKRQLFPEDWSRIKQRNMQKDSLRSVGTGDRSRSPTLPDEIWQHIFSFVPPVFLGRLLRVDRSFYACLTGTQSQHGGQTHEGRNALKPVDANSVWASSRKRFAPGLPKPLLGLQELEMWRLIRGRQCQMCGESKIQNFATSSESPLESGPGDKGVRVLWPFGIRTCGSCLQEYSEKEAALYMSPDCPYFLLSALPFAFVTATNHFVSSAALQGMAHLPPLRMEKHYYKPHIEDIKRRLREAQALGAPSAEEWMKGLSSEGKERQDDAVRWEQWEARGGLKKVNAKAPAKPASTPAISNIGPLLWQSKKGDDHSNVTVPQNLQLPAKPPVDLGTPNHSTDSSLPAVPGMSQLHPNWGSPTSYVDSFAPRPPGALPQPRPERNIRDVNEAKAIRKAEIERRCQQLQPPLLSNVLAHMDSFQAAIQISQPLTDSAWEVLKPRLLAQRPYAERKEKERIQQDELLQEEYKQRRQQEAQLKETKEALDREWDTIQAPVRNRISALADEIITDKWSNGDTVSKDTSPKFAADVLIYVRERFYADVAREEEESPIAGEPVKVDQPNEPPTRKLILENMKWLFDTKIKPLTENFQKELFLCNGCEGNFKFYGFEGVIQHYAAKHTTTLSMGSVVVHWRAEWPEHPPFHPNPSTAKAAYYKIPTPVNTSVSGPVNGELQPQPNFGFGQGPSTSAPSASVQPVYPSSQPPTEGFQAPCNGAQQNVPYTYPYPPEQVYHPYTSAATNIAPMPPPDTRPGVGHTAPLQAVFSHSNQDYSGYSQAPFGQHNPVYVPHIPGPQYPTYTQGQEFSTPGTYMSDPNRQFYGANGMAQPANYGTRLISLHPSGLTPEVYQRQLDELAKHAREVWFGTSGIKDIPQSVRIFVVIHHVASRFAVSFYNEPTLAMFIDGLDNHPKMRPVRSLNGLACKTCVNAGSGDHGQQVFSQAPVADPHIETYPAFHDHALASSHLKPDWKRDMIELPELSLIADLVHAQGIDDTKLSLIASVFPKAFPNPLPPVGRRSTNVGPVPVYGANQSTSGQQFTTAAQSVHHSQTTNSNTPDNHQPFARPVSAFGAPSPGAQSSEPVGEDEYDPHRPAYLGKIMRSESDSRSIISRNHIDPSPNHLRIDQTLSYGSDYVQYAATSQPSAAHMTRAVQDHTFGRSGSRKNSPDPRPRGGYAEGYADPAERHVYNDSNQRAYNENKNTKHQRTAGIDISLEDSISKRSGHQPISPDEAADQFLRNFQVSKPTVPTASGLYEQDVEPQSESTWADKASNAISDRRYSESVGPIKWTAGQSAGRQASDSHSIINSIRAASLISKAVEESSHGSKAKTLQEDDYRPPSHVQIPLNGDRYGRSPAPYDDFARVRQGPVPQPYAITDVERSREGRAMSYQQVRDPQYRSRSRSPRSAQVERTFYRSRSPINDFRHESMYEVLSPSLRKESQSQRLLSYDYPVREHYEYIDASIPSEERYGRRVELLPVRYEDPRPAEASRYIIAPRYEEPAPPPAYVRVEQGYAGEQFYERDGQLYRTGPGPQAFAQEYRY